MYKKFLAISLALVTVLSLAACGSKQPSAQEEVKTSESESSAEENSTADWPKYLGLAAGGASSQTGQVGSVFAPALTDYLGVSVSPEVSAGLTANLLIVNDGTCDLGMTGTDFAYEAWTGTADWTDETCQNFRSVMPLFPFIQTHYTYPESGIKGFADLEGKTINLSTAGSSTDTWVRRILDIAGINSNITNVSPSDSNAQMADRLTDAAVVNGLAPHSAVSEFSASNDVLVFGIDDNLYEKILEKYPFAGRYTIPAGTYKGQTEDIETINTYCILIANKDLDESLIYEMTKATFEHLEDLCGQHNAFTYVQTSLVNDMTTPLHKGAAKYYEEIGIQLSEAVKPID